MIYCFLIAITEYDWHVEIPSKHYMSIVNSLQNMIIFLQHLAGYVKRKSHLVYKENWKKAVAIFFIREYMLLNIYIGISFAERNSLIYEPLQLTIDEGAFLI